MESQRNMSILTVSDLTVRRGSTVILDRISWQVMPGEHWVILGENGSGKTSLLSTLTGYLTPTALQGKWTCCRNAMAESDWRELRKKVGLVSSAIRQMIQENEAALETIISGRHAMIDFWGRMTAAADRRRGMEILRQIECEKLAQRPWLFLSQGKRQRQCSSGAALMARPALLILDEPCAGLDPAAREHFLQFLEHLGRGKKAPALILVTHHMEEIMPVFSHVLILKRGRVLAAGERRSTITSKTLSVAFNAKVRLTRKNDRYSLEIQDRSRRVM